MAHYIENSLLDCGVGRGRGFTPLLLPKIFTPKWHSEALVRLGHLAAVNDHINVRKRKFASVSQAKLCEVWWIGFRKHSSLSRAIGPVARSTQVFEVMFARGLTNGAGCSTKHQKTDPCNSQGEMRKLSK